MIPSNSISKNQRGNILITTLFIVSIAVISCVMLAQRIHIGIQRAAITQTQLHAYELASLSSAWSASQIMQHEANSPSEPISHTTPGPQGTLVTPLLYNHSNEQGYHLQAALTDAQGCFNVNNLTQSDQIEFFKRLMSADAPLLDTNTTLQIETNILTSLLSLPSRQFTLDEQVRMAIGDKAYFAMKPELCILPHPTAINIRHASVSLLTALSQKSNMSHEAQQLHQQLTQIHTIEDLKKNPIAQKMDLDFKRITFQSEYFYHVATITHGDEHFYLRELLHITKNNHQHASVHVVWTNHY